MKGLNKISLALMILALSMTTASSAFTKESLPAINDEGMKLVKDSKMTTIYADPGADLSIYNRIWLQDATVAFKENWQRDQNRSNTKRVEVQARDMEWIQEEVATLFREVFTKELVAGGYELVEEAGHDVLSVVPAIVNLDVISPILKHEGNTYYFSEVAREMTLNLELFDSLTNDKIVKSTDRKRVYHQGRMQWGTNTSTSDYPSARRFMTSWAKALTALLDDTRASTGNSK